MTPVASPTWSRAIGSDRLVPPANGRRLAREIRGARLLMLPQASHIFFTDQPQASHAAVVDFLAEVEQLQGLTGGEAPRR